MENLQDEEELQNEVSTGIQLIDDEKARVQKVRQIATKFAVALGAITPSENLLDYLVKEALKDAHFATKMTQLGEVPDYIARGAARKQLLELAGYDKKANITIINNPSTTVSKDELGDI